MLYSVSIIQRRSIATLAVSALVVLAWGCRKQLQHANPGSTPPPAQSLSVIAADVLHKNRIPGLAVGVVRDGKVSESAVAGDRRVGQLSPIRAQDRFHLGSCTKLITNLMIYRLIDQHKLDLNTTLGEVLKNVPMLSVYRTVTVGQLLSFKGGIAPYLLIGPQQTPEVFDSRGTAEEQRGRFVAHVLNEQPAASPGTQAVYSNASYAVAAYIASRVTGRNWEELVQDLVLNPLKMKNSGFGRPATLSSPKAPSGHFKEASGWVAEALGYVHPASLSAAGDVSASIEDFARLAAEELRIARGESTLLSKSTAELMRDNSDLKPGRTILGGGGAFTAGITLWPDQNFATVVAVNSGQGDQICRSVCTGLKAMYVDGKTFAEAPAPKQGYGFMMGLAPGGRVVIGNVEPGSVADKAGLSVGDEIVAMNDRPMEAIPDQERFAIIRKSPLTLAVKRSGAKIKIKMILP